MHGTFRPPRSAAARTGWDYFLAYVEKRGEGGRKKLERWNARRSGTPGWGRLRADYETFVHRHLYHVTPAEIAGVAARTDHPLGNLNGEASRFDWGKGRGSVKDWSPPPVLYFVWHSVLEDLGRMPLWQDVWRFLVHDRPDLVTEPFASHFGLGAGWINGGRHRDGLLWRLGLSYYGFLRETDVLARLRHRHGRDVRYHFLIDAEWAADLVGGDVLAAIYVSNPVFRDTSAGRKRLCEDMNPGFRTVVLNFGQRTDYGAVWLVHDDDIGRAAVTLRDAGCPLI